MTSNMWMKKSILIKKEQITKKKMISNIAMMYEGRKQKKKEIFISSSIQHIDAISFTIQRSNFVNGYKNRQ